MIQHQIQGMILKAGAEACRVPMTTHFAYDPDADPYAVTLTFLWTDGDGDNTVAWTVGRELLVRGAASVKPYGSGNFRLRYDGPGTNRVIACLRNPEGHADISLNHIQLREFLDAVEAVVPLGTECVTDLIDEALKEILGS